MLIETKLAKKLLAFTVISMQVFRLSHATWEATFTSNYQRSQ